MYYIEWRHRIGIIRIRLGEFSLQASGNQICNWGDTDSSGFYNRYNAGCITLTPTTYSCPLAGGSACNASHQCTSPGTCTFIPSSCTLPWGGPIVHGASVTGLPQVLSPAGRVAHPRPELAITELSPAHIPIKVARSVLLLQPPLGRNHRLRRFRHAYSASSVACGSSCTSQTRTCTNTVLSGTYTNQTCSVAECPPTVNLSANPTTITSGGSSTLTWSSTNATSCTGSGSWSGSKSTSGATRLSYQQLNLYAYLHRSGWNRL